MGDETGDCSSDSKGGVCNFSISLEWLDLGKSFPRFLYISTNKTVHEEVGVHRIVIMHLDPLLSSVMSKICCFPS